MNMLRRSETEIGQNRLALSPALAWRGVRVLNSSLRMAVRLGSAGRGLAAFAAALLVPAAWQRGSALREQD